VRHIGWAITELDLSRRNLELVPTEGLGQH
jgi:hypothetical protein